MVRLVFRHCAKVRRSICTSKSPWTFSRISSGFVLLVHNSPSSGSACVGAPCGRRPSSARCAAGFRRTRASRRSAADRKIRNTDADQQTNTVPVAYRVHVVSELSMGWVGLGRDFSVLGGLRWVHYSKSTKNLERVMLAYLKHG